MRRTIEIAVIIVFLSLGVLLVLGRLPLPQLAVDMQSLLPAGASEGTAASCSSCSADCPYAVGSSDDKALPAASLEQVDGELVGEEELREEFPALAKLPLSGGAVEGYRAEKPKGEPRVWIDIATCSPLGEAAEWYRRHLRQAGRQLIRDDDTTVPDAVVLSFEQSGSIINILIEERSDRTNIFLDLPDTPSRL